MVERYIVPQVVEYDTPEKLLLNNESAFSKMVQSTGVANAQYLRSLVLGGEGEHKSTADDDRLDGQRRWLASSRWAAAAQFALAVSLTSSQNDLQRLEIEDEDNILKKTKDAVITLQGVLEGKHDKAIEETLEQYEVPKDRWWSSLYKVVEGKKNHFFILDCLELEIFSFAADRLFTNKFYALSITRAHLMTWCNQINF